VGAPAENSNSPKITAISQNAAAFGSFQFVDGSTLRIGSLCRRFSDTRILDINPSSLGRIEPTVGK
jgi:hypothetical protein